MKEFLNVELPRVQQRKVDLLLRLVDGTLLHIEFQTRNHRDMAARMGEYYYWLVRKFGCHVRQIVIYTGNGRLTMPSRFDLRGNVHQFELLDLRDVSAAELLKSSRYVDNVLAFLAGGADSKQQRVWDILLKISGMRPSDRELALGFLGAISGLRDSEIIMDKEIASMGQLVDWKKNKILARLHSEGLEQGLEQGQELAYRRMLLQVIRHSFGRVPKWATERIASAKLQQLEKWASNFAGAQSVEDILGAKD